MKKILLILLGVGIITILAFNNYTNEPQILLHSDYINSSNKDLIGKETIIKHSDNTQEKREKGISKSNIVKSSDEYMQDETEVSEFIVSNNKVDYITPEIILINGSIGIFTKSDGSGWNLEKEDQLILNFNKYQSEVVQEQALIVGYIKDGHLTSGEIFKSIKGSYKYVVNEPGEYYIYVLNASSDNLALKEGTIISTK